MLIHGMGLFGMVGAQGWDLCWGFWLGGHGYSFQKIGMGHVLYLRHPIREIIIYYLIVWEMPLVNK